MKAIMVRENVYSAVVESNDSFELVKKISKEVSLESCMKIKLRDNYIELQYDEVTIVDIKVKDVDIKEIFQLLQYRFETFIMG